MNTIKIHYRFKFGSGEKKDYLIQLDPDTISYINSNIDFRPEWTRLGFHQCENCPLSLDHVIYCPVAVNLSSFVEYFKNEISHDEALVLVQTEERYSSKKISLQEGLYSIYGLIMSTSDCPNMNFLKPMARFHMPFASMEETVFRAVSTYLLEQYFAHKKGEEVDIKLTGLLNRYKEVEKVNVGISNRLRAVTSGDADRNALSLLDSLAQVLFFELEKSLESLEYLFKREAVKAD
ncbi:MAG: hypothetical protein OEV78_03815 [Spirochaetia bacterium]|nr:hypothetical protein [Spirochaetia bacterium]